MNTPPAAPQALSFFLSVMTPLSGFSWLTSVCSIQRGEGDLVIESASGFLGAMLSRRVLGVLAGFCVHLAGCHSLSSTRAAADGDAAASYHADAGVLDFVNPKIGTLGFTPNDNGGMIPSVGVPFGMTRWTPQTRENFISQVPYSDGDGLIHGLQGTHQPAIWMGESGQVVLSPGLDVGDGVKAVFQERGLRFLKEDERSTPYVYEVLLDAAATGTQDWELTEEAVGEGPVPGGAGGVPDSVKEGANGRVRRNEHGKASRHEQPGKRNQTSSSYERAIQVNSYISYSASFSFYDGRTNTLQVAMSATAHVGHLRLDFIDNTYGANGSAAEPYLFIQASRLNWTGHVEIDAMAREISGSNSQRQDYLIGPDKAKSFRGYFVSRFSEPFASYGTSKGANIQEGADTVEDKFVGGYVRFDKKVKRVEVRTGVSFVSVDQARRNLDFGIPDGTRFETTVEKAKAAWLEKLGRVSIEGVNQTDAEHDPRIIWYTGLFHALQYPNDYSEPISKNTCGTRLFYSGYTDSVHHDTDSYYQSWSIWDTYRAEHSLLTIFAPERVNGMMRSLLRIFDWSGWLPMWANVVETNIMIATNADVVLANALTRGFRGFNIKKAWAAVKKDAYVPPDRDTELLYYDREPDTPAEARAGLTSYMKLGWVSNDGWAESASRTLDYAFDDFAAAVVAEHAGNHAAAEELMARSKNYAKLWNNETQFMQARNANGSWANDTWGWTEGDKWAYTFDVLHDAADGLAGLFAGGRAGMKAKLDEHFTGSHNEHSNEPSHHIPYLYSAIGYPASAADTIRDTAWDNYNATSAGLRGNEDLGQMSAWYVFSALGFYPVNPASDEYVVGTPFFEKVTIRLPAGVLTGGDARAKGGAERTLEIKAPGATVKPYVKSLRVDGKVIRRPVLTHGQVLGAGCIEFEMSEEPTSWGKSGI